MTPAGEATSNGHRPDLLTLRQAAEVSGRSVESVRHAAKRNRFPTVMVAGHRLVAVRDLEAWASARPARVSPAAHGDHDEHSSSGETGISREAVDVDRLAAAVLVRVDEVLAGRAVELDELARRRSAALAEIEQRLAEATAAAQAAKDEEQRLRLTRQAWEQRRAELYAATEDRRLGAGR
jgi:hypothetical protein